MVYFYQLFFSTDDVILKLCTSLCQKAKCTLFVWSTVFATMGMFVTLVMESNMLGHIFAQAHDADPFHIETLPSVGTVGVHILVVLGE